MKPGIQVRYHLAGLHGCAQSGKASQVYKENRHLFFLAVQAQSPLADGELHDLFRHIDTQLAPHVGFLEGRPAGVDRELPGSPGHGESQQPCTHQHDVSKHDLLQTVPPNKKVVSRIQQEDHREAGRVQQPRGPGETRVQTEARQNDGQRIEAQVREIQDSRVAFIGK